MKSHAKNTRKTKDLVYWSITALFCLQMGFTAYAQLRLPQVADAFAHLGFPDYFRVQLSWAKLLGVALLLAPVPARLKEWAYAGFAIDLASALIAHLALHDGPQAWGWAAATGVLWGFSYLLWRGLELRRDRDANELATRAPSPASPSARPAARVRAAAL
jgi:hypothetical protein